MCGNALGLLLTTTIGRAARGGLDLKITSALLQFSGQNASCDRVPGTIVSAVATIGKLFSQIL
jgi:hypothetical protein